ncbi:inositol monophosphatase family protein [Pseudarthrobacter sulfonivorans]|uniref:inositol monophosphatase family protein n=1 Tax=Pseudarthrobacter sulfonivorans TaxID=121292 RepID=UPI0021040102|nr:inositol monophosphatase family protein [Pseudarthrobacter sulfonivorans]
MVDAVKNHAESMLQSMHWAPVYLSSEPGHWMEDETAWVLNLLDGRENLITGIEHGAVTYALVARGRPIVGAVAPVFSNGWYMAAVELGSWSQKDRQEPQRVEVSSAGTLAESTLTFGLPPSDKSAAAFRPAARMRTKARGVRLRGCSSLDLVDVARGATHGHFEASVRPADAAAGMLILDEAGGISTDWRGQIIHARDSAGTVNLAASNGRIQREIVQILATTKAGSVGA